jgi:hypothetical protein
LPTQLRIFMTHISAHITINCMNHHLSNPIASQSGGGGTGAEGGTTLRGVDIGFRSQKQRSREALYVECQRHK